VRERRWWRMTPSAWPGAANLAHDTLLAPTCWSPQARLSACRLCEERGLASELDDPLAVEALLLGVLADWQREQIVERGLEQVMQEIELPLVAVLREMELLGVAPGPRALAEITERVRAEIDGLEREIFALADEEFLISSPQQLGRSCSRSWAVA